jgi:NitT/TauT family transport system substrate-binding protein
MERRQPAEILSNHEESTMNTAQQERTGRFGRRKFLATASALGLASVLGRTRTVTAAAALETTKIRLVHTEGMCLAPQYIAEELLRAEGFTQIEYVKLLSETGSSAVAAGRADFSMWDLPGTIPLLDEGRPLVVLSGVHSGCWDLIGNDRVQTVLDLKGKTVAVYAIGGGDQILLSSMLAYVGVDPRKDIKWVASNTLADNMRLFEEGKADAFMAFEPQQQELREKKLGRLVVNTAMDRPWSQYFCCMLYGNRAFVNNNPVATKRAMRALFKAIDACALNPERAARLVVDKGFSPRYDFAVGALKAIPYNVWRSYDPEATLRFHTLRLREVGMLKSTPNDFIARTVDWRFLNELKQELKV